MARIKLRHVQAFNDRHGRPRYYFRRHGSQRVPLPGVPGSQEFMDAYQGALADAAAPPKRGADRFTPGSVAAAVATYKSYGPFTASAPSTQRDRRSVLDRFCDEHGAKRIAKLTRGHIDAIIAKKSPSAVQHFIKAMRGFTAYCVAAGLRADDPMVGIKNPRVKTAGYYTWNEADIATFRARHPVGTRARLALEIALNTAQRRGDIIRLGRQHVRNGAIHIKQRKTGQAVEIPVHADLAAVLDMTPIDNMIFLTTERGGPFSELHFTNWFLAMCREAGLPGCSVHGLRKAACRRLAEAGCTEHEIMAISGHRTLEEVARYTRAADRARMARSGMAKIAGNETDRQQVEATSVKPAQAV